jgi:hypothetical protein
MKKYRLLEAKTYVILTFCLLLISFQSVHSQIYAGIGLDAIKGFTVANPYAGMSVMLERQEDEHSVYARFCSTLSKNEKQESLSYLLNDYSIADSIIGNLTYRYNTLEIGRRNFYGDDLEYGLGFFTAEHVTISYNRVGINLLNAPSNYSLPSLFSSSGNILSFAIGANAGVQYAFVRGILFSEIGFNYSLTGGMPSNTTAQITTSYSGITFTANFGVKKMIRYDY